MEQYKVLFQIKSLQKIIFKKFLCNNNKYNVNKEFLPTPTQMQIIAYIMAHENEEIYQKDIEKHFNLSHPTVIGILKRLQSKDLIIIKRSEKDKRKRNIILTKKVTDSEEKMYAKKNAIEEHIKSLLSDEEISELERLLKILCENIIYKL